MKANDWKKINEVVADALSLEPSERQKFIGSTDLTDEQRAEAASLLSVSNFEGSILEASAISFTKDFFHSDPFSMIGKKIGSFTVEHEIAHGGMGAVFSAFRRVGNINQHVAIKMLRREMNSAVLRQRFEREREILATLEHPNISRLIDFGTTSEDIPYIAMEFIDGIPIDDFCNSNNFSLDQRLELFQKVCSAVSSAHRTLIVHRDLKPSNILVTSDGTPKLLDFGISKIVSDIDSGTAATVTKLGAMTPGYASPEQLRGNSVTTSTDIYSLGVILFELLSGHRPFEDKENDFGEILKAVSEVEPPIPSSLATHQELPEQRLQFSLDGSVIKTKGFTDDNKTRSDGKTKFIQFSGIRSQELRGDLDNIIIRALQKEPERRYLSADAFSDDIDRFRRGMPVLARPNTFYYRAVKFFRRNRIITIAGLILSIAIALGLFTTLWQANIARNERAKAENRFNDVRNLANSFLFEITPDIERLPGSTPAKAKLVTRALEYLNKLSADTDNDPQLLIEIANAYDKVGDVQGNPNGSNIGDINGAKESYQKALNIRLELSKSLSNDTAIETGIADDYQMLGTLESFGGDYSNAAPLLERSLELRKTILSDDPSNFALRRKLAQTLKSRGLIPFFEGNNKAAIDHYKQSQDIYLDLLHERPLDDDIASEYWYLWVSIGEAKGWDNDFKGASQDLQKGLDQLIIIAGRHPYDWNLQRKLNLAYQKRAENYEDLTQFAKAIELYKLALANSKISSEADPANFTARRDVAMAYKKLGQAQEANGQADESLDSIQNSVEVFDSLKLGDRNNAEYAYDSANVRISLAMTYTRLKRFDDALVAHNKAKEGLQDTLRINSDNVYARRMLANNYIETANALKGSKASAAEIRAAYQSGLEGLKELKNEGKLNEVDMPVIIEVEKKIAAISDQ